MATKLLRSDGKQPVIGDDVPVKITATVPSGTTLSKAWITFKLKKTDDDPGVLQKTITSGFTVVTATKIEFTITLAKAETALFVAGKTYFFDVQGKDSSGNIQTLLPDGEAVWQRGVTAASS